VLVFPVVSYLIALMMEAARTSETSVDIQLRTRQYIPEDSELHTRRCESLKSHMYHITSIAFILLNSNVTISNYFKHKNIKHRL
jgi:hypothetical protein